MKTIAEFDNVRLCYENVCALEGVNFNVPSNQMTVFTGPNGGGKTTLIKLLIGFLNPNEGEIVVNKNLSIGYVAQEYGFDKSFPITVKEMVLSGTIANNIHPFFKYTKEHNKRAQNAIETVGLEGLEKRGISQLSSGQLKRTIIARVLATEADIIVLDEPDSNLDAKAIKELYELLNILKLSKTIVLVSHNIDYILDIADKAIYVNKTTTCFNNPLQLKEKLERGLLI
ncbi:MAG TPA: ATP-binding cassette domain-containing protein [Anaerovoracaceae bacterium]|nr:ATP-binding cassette domain-containing protein [Anaerovoracaceae bacterium]